MSGQQQFRPIGELEESDGVVIERRGEHWHGQIADAVDRAIDDGETTYLVEDGRTVAVIGPYRPAR